MDTEIQRPNLISPDALLTIIASQNFHHDQLIWGQIQTLIAIQAATLGAAYVTRDTWLAGGVACLAIVFGLLLFFYTDRVQQSRDVNMGLADKLIEKYGGPLAVLVGEDENGFRLRFAPPMPHGRWVVFSKARALPMIRGWIILRTIFVLFFLIEGGALLVFSPVLESIRRLIC